MKGGEEKHGYSRYS